MTTLTFAAAVAMTDAQIELLPMKALVEVYNTFAANLGYAAVNRFADRPAGIKRTLNLAPAVRVIAEKAAAEKAAADATQAAAVRDVKKSLGEVATTTKVDSKTGATTIQAKDPRFSDAAPLGDEAKAHGKVTIVSRIRAGIAAGKTNAEIWAIVQPEFGMQDKHRGMVAWHRANDLRRAKRA